MMDMSRLSIQQCIPLSRAMMSIHHRRVFRLRQELVFTSVLLFVLTSISIGTALGECDGRCQTKRTAMTAGASL